MVRARDLEIDKDSGVSSPSLAAVIVTISLARTGHALTPLNCFHKLKNFMQVQHTVKLSSKPMSSISSIIRSAWFREDPLGKEMATHSSILAWRIPWTEEPHGLQSMGSQRVGHDWVTNSDVQGIRSSPVGVKWATFSQNPLWFCINSLYTYFIV